MNYTYGGMAPDNGYIEDCPIMNIDSCVTPIAYHWGGTIFGVPKNCADT
jgi:hypothetical protein